MADDLDSLLESLVPGAARSGAAAMDDPPFPPGLNLELRGVLGRGGFAVVFDAWDPVLERRVAVKIARPAGGAPAREALLAEARRTARIDHPAVLPILDLRAADGLLCVTLPVIDGPTLREASADPAFDASARIRVLAAIAGALAAAHRVGVVHGDVHPDNILAEGRAGPTLLDWGPLDARGGAVSGHVGYAAPEVLRGATPTEASDAWSLGALLYEALSGRPLRPPSPREGASSYVRRVLQAEAPSAPDELPEHPGLRELVTALLASDPAARPTAEHAATVLARVVTGRAERHRRARRAEALHAHALQSIERIEETMERLSREREALAVQQSKVPGHASIQEKRPIWEAGDRIGALVDQGHAAWWRAVEAAGEAFVLSPDPDGPKRTLAGLWWRALKAAERDGPSHLIPIARDRIRQLDGTLSRTLVDAPGEVSVQVDVAGAEVCLARFEERGRRLVAVEVETRPLPLRRHPLPQGSWLLTLRAPGRVPLPTPVLVRRLEHTRLELALPTPEQVGEGYVPMPEGAFVLGGDRRARQPLPRCEPFVGARYLKRTLVTSAEWKAFLDALPVERAREHVPGEAGLFGGFRPAWTHGADGWVPPEGWDLRWPIFSIHWHDAQAYAAWRSEVEGRVVRLPTEEEWEKAARGADGRAYPWGDGFDPTWCRMRQSEAGPPHPCPVGSYPVDTSIFGCVDMAGLLRELTSSRFDEGQIVLRGGTWGDDADDCRAACRSGIQPTMRSSFVGFRLVVEP